MRTRRLVIMGTLVTALALGLLLWAARPAGPRRPFSPPPASPLPSFELQPKPNQEAWSDPPASVGGWVGRGGGNIGSGGDVGSGGAGGPWGTNGGGGGGGDAGGPGGTNGGGSVGGDAGGPWGTNGGDIGTGPGGSGGGPGGIQTTMYPRYIFGGDRPTLVSLSRGDAVLSADSSTVRVRPSNATDMDSSRGETWAVLPDAQGRFYVRSAREDGTYLGADAACRSAELVRDLYAWNVGPTEDDAVAIWTDACGAARYLDSQDGTATLTSSSQPPWRADAVIAKKISDVQG